MNLFLIIESTEMTGYLVFVVSWLILIFLTKFRWAVAIICIPTLVSFGYFLAGEEMFSAFMSLVIMLALLSVRYANHLVRKKKDNKKGTESGDG